MHYYITDYYALLYTSINRLYIFVVNFEQQEHGKPRLVFLVGSFLVRSTYLNGVASTSTNPSLFCLFVRVRYF